MIDIEIGMAQPGLSLGLPADAQNLPVVRQAFRAFAQLVGLGGDGLGDAELAMTEATSNVVKHAYAGAGEIEITLSAEDGQLLANVRDSGRGIPPQILSSGRGEEGYGLMLMSGTATELGISSSELGTEVAMAFDLDPEEDVEPAPGGSELILRRIVAVLGAQADLSFERLTEAVLAGELLVVHSPARLDGDVLKVSAEHGPALLELTSGPYVPDGADSLLADTEAPVIGRVLEKLCDKIDLIRSQDGQEWLKLHVEGGSS